VLFSCGRCEKELWRSSSGYFPRINCPFCGSENLFSDPFRESPVHIQGRVSAAEIDGGTARTGQT
jgi:DNA-directed RNA polymerase subunit RPC12/RpoP